MMVEMIRNWKFRVCDGVPCTCSTMNCACRSSESSVKLVQPIDCGGTVV